MRALAFRVVPSLAPLLPLAHDGCCRGLVAGYRSEENYLLGGGVTGLVPALHGGLFGMGCQLVLCLWSNSAGLAVAPTQQSPTAQRSACGWRLRRHCKGQLGSTLIGAWPPLAWRLRGRRRSPLVLCLRLTSAGLAGAPTQERPTVQHSARGRPPLAWRLRRHCKGQLVAWPPLAWWLRRHRQSPLVLFLRLTSASLAAGLPAAPTQQSPTMQHSDCLTSAGWADAPTLQRPTWLRSASLYSVCGRPSLAWRLR